MALQDAILTALAHDESSGYDLAKAFDVSVANYWTASPQQLYRELDKMEEAGLVTARVVCRARGVPLYGVPSLDAVARTAQVPDLGILDRVLRTTWLPDDDGNNVSVLARGAYG